MTNIETEIDKTRLPKHVAIIMDGNGRWAKKKGLDRTEGHTKGADSVHEITEAAARLGISYLTLYTFSMENWNRPKEEVEAIMNLLVWAIEQKTETLMNNNVRLLSIGEQAGLPNAPREKLQNCIDKTAGNTGLTLILALNYSSRSEIVRATKIIANAVSDKKINVEDINEDSFSNYLFTKDIPDPDLLIRTGGETRISNFLLWQLSYTELYFTDVYWPDFGKNDLDKAILHYQARERRFGKTSEQL